MCYSMWSHYTIYTLSKRRFNWLLEEFKPLWISEQFNYQKYCNLASMNNLDQMLFEYGVFWFKTSFSHSQSHFVEMTIDSSIYIYIIKLIITKVSFISFSKPKEEQNRIYCASMSILVFLNIQLLLKYKKC